MTIVRCDRCGKEITQGETYWIIQANPTDQLGKPMFKQSTINKMFTEPSGNELCNDCGKELGKWMRHEEERDKKWPKIVVRDVEIDKVKYDETDDVNFYFKPRFKSLGWKAVCADGEIHGGYEKLDELWPEMVIAAFGRQYEDAMRTMREVGEKENGQ